MSCTSHCVVSGNEWVASMLCAIASSHPPPHAHAPAVDAIEDRQTSKQTDMQEATANHISKVPLFAFIERVDDNNEHHDELQEKFLNEIFVRLEYKTYTPGEILVNFSDAADRMLIFIEGKSMSSLTTRRSHGNLSSSKTATTSGTWRS